MISRKRNVSAPEAIEEITATVMSAHSNQPVHVVRGQSRFCLRVQLSRTGLRPYAWEIYDDEDTKIVRRSPETFRTSADAWAAGMVVLQTPD